MKFNPFSSFSIFKLLIQLKSGKSFSYVQYFSLIAHSITLFIHTEIEIFPFFTHTFFYFINQIEHASLSIYAKITINLMPFSCFIERHKSNSILIFPLLVFSMNFLYNFFGCEQKWRKNERRKNTAIDVTRSFLW